MKQQLSATSLRAYQGIWIQLKNSKEHKVVLEVVDSCYVPRIIRMVSKEKDQDNGFKLLNHTALIRLKTSWNEERKELTLMLKARHDLVSIKGTGD